MPISEQDKSDIVANALDPNKVYFRCGKHNYYGSTKLLPNAKPATNCSDCWRVYYITYMANVPPSEREQQLQELEEVMANLVQAVEQGRWDFKVFNHPEISVEKDAL